MIREENTQFRIMMGFTDRPFTRNTARHKQREVYKTMFHILEGNEIQIKIAKIPLIRIRINKSMLPVMCWCWCYKTVWTLMYSLWDCERLWKRWKFLAKLTSFTCGPVISVLYIKDWEGYVPVISTAVITKSNFLRKGVI